MWKPESRVAVVLAEGPQQADAILAVSVRCCCIPLDAGLPEAVLEEALRRTGAEAVLAGIDRRVSLPVLDLADLPAVGAPPPVRFRLTTSGTTGGAKVVSLTSEMVQRSCQNIAEALQLSPQDRMGRGAALHHVYGLMHYLAGHYAGGSAVCPAASSASDQWRAFVEGDVTWIAAVPSWHRSLLEAARRHGGRPPRLRLLRSSTAPLSTTLAAEIERVMEAPVVEGYGMTETTSQVASQPLDPAQRKWGSVGRVWGVTVTVVDEGGAALAPGQLGRIVVEGPTVFEGRHDTGDMGYLDADGFLFLAGRQDDIINRGGNKISPAQVERILERHPAVRRALVLGLPDARLGQEVAAAIVGAVEEKELRAYAAAHLADYEQPRRYWLREELPEGKRARRELAASWPLGSRSDGGPDGGLLQLIYELFCEALGGADLHTGFFAQGGDSIAGASLMNQIQERLGLTLSPALLFQYDTPVALAAHLQSAYGPIRLESGPPLAAVTCNDGQELPLSYAQERMWVVTQTLPDTPLDNSGRFLLLRGSLNRPALEKALEQLWMRHEILRTTFHQRDGRPFQRVHARMPSPWYRYLEMDESEAAVEARREAARVFDYEREGLYRVTLVRLLGERHREERHGLFLMRHHMVSDGWSTPLMLRDLREFYAANCEGRAARLPEIRRHYGDFARWQRAQEGEADLDYWRPILAELAVPPLVGGEGACDYSCHYRVLTLKPELVTGLEGLATDTGTTLYGVLLAAFKGLWSRYAEQEEVVLGSPYANRNQVDWEPLLGYFVNTMLLRTDCSGNPSGLELLARVRAVLQGAYAHQALPFEELLRRLRGERGADPPFRILFVMQNAPHRGLTWPGLEVEPWGPGPTSVRFDLEVHVFARGARGGKGDDIEVWWVWKQDGLAVALLEELMAAYQQLLQALRATPERRLNELLANAPEPPRRLWSRLGGSDGYGPETRLVDTGATSLAVMELAVELERRWGQRVPLGRLLGMTLGELGRPQPPGSPAMIELQQRAGSLPCFFIHGAGGGGLIFRPLRGLLKDHSLYAFQALDRQLPDSLEALAGEYLEELRRVAPDGPLLLMGLSLGGAIGWEMARQLWPRPVALVLLDSWRPGWKTPTQSTGWGWPSPVLAAHRLGQRFHMHLGNFLRMRWAYLGHKLRGRGGARRPARVGDLRPLYDGYRAGPYGGHVTLLRARHQPLQAGHQPCLGWQGLAASMEVRSIAGMHGEILLESPILEIVARELLRVLKLQGARWEISRAT